MMMDEKQVEEIKRIFSKWDPLKQTSTVVKDLDNYDTEASDFLFHASKTMNKKSLEKLAIEIIEQAFNITIDSGNTGNLSEEIYKIVHEY